MIEGTWTAEDIMKLLKARYKTRDRNGYNTNVVLEKVANGTGGFQQRWIDAVVFNMFPSKGLTRSAFEIKVSRSDFIRELQHPEKHQWCKEYFHEFWFIAPKDVLQVGELPTNAGWMCPQKTRLCIFKHAVRNDNPKLDNVILASFMRAFGKHLEDDAKYTEKDILANSSAYKQAKVFQDTTMKFLGERGRHLYHPLSTEEQILKELHEATMDKQLKEDREHLITISQRFQEQVTGLLNSFLAIANKSLLARNELGEHIVSAFGGFTDEGVSSLRKHIKDNEKEIAKLIRELPSDGK